MRYFLDTEFWDKGNSIELISIGIVSTDGRELYLENSEFDWMKCDSRWLIDNVMPNLRAELDPAVSQPKEVIKARVIEFVGYEPEFWADYAAYDWVVLCQLYGPMIKLPKRWPMFCNDVQCFANILGQEALPDVPWDQAHNALYDARNVKERWQYLQKKLIGPK